MKEKDILNKRKELIIIILIITALVLGYLLFQFPQVSNFLNKSLEFMQREVKDEKTSNEFTADEKKVLIIPNNDSTDKEKADHSKLVEKLAKEVDTVVVKDCLPIPLALKIKIGESFKIRNDGKATITIAVNKDNINEIAAGETKSFKADFGFGPGVYGYACNSSDATSGIFFVTE